MKCRLLHILFQSRDKNYDVSSWSILLILLKYISNIKFTLLNFLPVNTFYQKIIIKTKNKKNRGMKRKAKGICHRIRRSSWSSLKHPLPSIDKNFSLVTYIKNNVVVNSHLVHFSVKRRMRCYCIPTVGSAPCYLSGLDRPRATCRASFFSYQVFRTLFLLWYEACPSTLYAPPPAICF